MRTNEASCMLLAVLLLVAGGLHYTAAMSMQSYIEQGVCQSEQICQYNYEVQQHLTEREEQSFVAKLSVEITCNSVGVFNGSAATQYCMTLRDTQISGEVFKDDSDEERRGKQQFLDELFSGWFCFVQSENGKIVAVYHASGENPEALNFKKTIAAAFQANFQGTEEEEEQDPQSMHKSHYQHIVTGKEGIVKMHRMVESGDVADYPSGANKKDVKLVKDEDVEYHSGTLFHSRGTTSVSVGTSSGGGDLDSIITPETFSGHGSYSLDLQRCYSLSQTVHSRKRRSLEEEIERDFEEDSLKATMDEAKMAADIMEQLREQIPSVTEALQKIHDNPEQLKMVDILQQLLVLEAQYGPLPQYTPALTDVMDYLFQLMDSLNQNDVDMRIFIYYLLRVEESPQSQMLLANGLSHAPTEDEKTAITLQIAFIENPHIDLVTEIEQQLNEQPNEGLLLSYGALASEASPAIKTRIVTFLLQQHTAATAINNTNTLTHIIYALGNTGTEQALPTIIEYLHYPTLNLRLVAVNSLTKLTHVQLVQDTFIHMLTVKNQNEKMVSAIVEVLVIGTEYSQQHDLSIEPKEELISALVSAALTFNNTDLHELVASYLHGLTSEKAATELQRLQDNRLSETRKKRGTTNWNDGNDLYDLIASQSSRTSDEALYPLHRAYLWGYRVGIDEANLQLAAGVFAGVSRDCVAKMKVFGKAVAQGNLLGRSYTFAHAEFLVKKENYNIRGKIYCIIGGNVLVNEDRTVDARYSCLTRSRPLSSSRYRILGFSYSIFIYVGFLRVGVYMDAEFNMNFNQEICGGFSGGSGEVASFDAMAGVDPTFTAIAGGSASASLLSLVRGGVSVDVRFNYKVEPETNCEFCYVNCDTSYQVCAAMYGSSPNNYIDLYAWYQSRRVKWCRASSWLGGWSYPCGIEWGTQHRWNAFSKRWDLSSSGRRALFSACSGTSNPQCSAIQ